jgi:hypothetical protein
MMHLQEDDEDEDSNLESNGLAKLVAKWKTGFTNIKDTDISKQ